MKLHEIYTSKSGRHWFRIFDVTETHVRMIWNDGAIGTWEHGWVLEGYKYSRTLSLVEQELY